MENTKNSNSENLKNAICYIPFGGVWLFFTEENKSKQLTKNIRYGSILLLAFILIRFIIVGILMIPFGSILFLLYIGITGFFGYKAFSGEKFNIEYIDTLEKKVKDSKTGDKKDDVKSKDEEKDKDILNF